MRTKLDEIRRRTGVERCGACGLFVPTTSERCPSCGNPVTQAQQGLRDEANAYLRAKHSRETARERSSSKFRSAASLLLFAAVSIFIYGAVKSIQGERQAQAAIERSNPVSPAPIGDDLAQPAFDRAKIYVGMNGQECLDTVGAPKKVTYLTTELGKRRFYDYGHTFVTIDENDRIESIVDR